VQVEVDATGRGRGPWKTRKLLVTGIGAAYLAFLIVFAYLAGGADPFPGDLRVSLWLQSWRTPWLDAVMTGISAIGYRPWALPLVALTTAVLYITGRRKQSGLLLAVLLTTTVAVTVISNVVARPRPPDDLLQVFRYTGAFSFPSSHVMHATVFLGTLTFTVAGSWKPGLARRLVLASLVLALAAMGASRLYLGAHWLSDVVGGYAFGAVLLAAAIGLWRRWMGRPDTSPTGPSDDTG
jgi:undecaprenyl-diphosphatase